MNDVSWSFVIATTDGQSHESLIFGSQVRDFASDLGR